jgi:hypothetical protein
LDIYTEDKPAYYQTWLLYIDVNYYSIKMYSLYTKIVIVFVCYFFFVYIQIDDNKSRHIHQVMNELINY